MGRRQQYLLGGCFNALIPLALLHIQVQSSYHVHTHQLWSSKKTHEPSRREELQYLFKNLAFTLLVSVVLGSEPRALYLLGKSSAT